MFTRLVCLLQFYQLEHHFYEDDIILTMTKLFQQQFHKRIFPATEHIFNNQLYSSCPARGLSCRSANRNLKDEIPRPWKRARTPE